MKEIVNVSKTWGIGKDGDLLINFPEDMKFFRETTRGATVIMGSTTLESFPGMAPLKNRINIVMIDDDRKIKQASLDAAKAAEDKGEKTKLIYVHSIDEAIAEARKYPHGTLNMTTDSTTTEKPDALKSADEHIFVIGGATIYRIMLDYCDTALVTINDCDREADTFFPNLDEKTEWKMTDPGTEMVAECGVKYRFTTWKRL